MRWRSVRSFIIGNFKQTETVLSVACLLDFTLCLYRAGRVAEERKTKIEEKENVFHGVAARKS